MNGENTMWYSALSSALDTLLSHIASVLPALFAAIVILLAGFVLAKLVKVAISSLLERSGIERLAASTGIQGQLKRFGETVTLSRILAGLSFWIIFLLFFVTAAETLGFPQLTSTIDAFVLFLPKLIAAALILLFGLAAANLARGYVHKSAAEAGFDFAKPLANMIYALMILLVASIAISQLEIETRLLDALIAVAFAAMGLGSAISMGLGSKQVSENIMYSIYVADHVEEGDLVTLKDGTTGRVLSIGTVAVTLGLDDNSRKIIKNSEFLDQLVIKS